MAMRDFEELRRATEQLTSDEQLHLAQLLIARARKGSVAPKQKRDISEFFGVYNFPEDALEYQHRIRAEWDR